MNEHEEYLLVIGNQVSEIRKLLDWSQDKLAQKIGVSRPIILNIEKDPTKMNKLIAFGLFSAVMFEIEVRSKNVQLINYGEWNNPLLKEKIINQIKANGISSAAVGAALMVFNPIVGSMALLTAVTSLFFKKSKTTEEKEFQPEEVERIANETMNSIKSKIASLFGLDKLELIQFVKKVQPPDTLVESEINE